MENQPTSQAVQKPRRKNKPIYAVISLIAVVLSCIFLLSVYSEIQTTMALKAQVEEARAQLETVQQENDYLLVQKEKLNDEDYIQSYARGKYSVSKEGEQVFYLSPLDK